MAEAEDVIVDAARHATSYAMDLWRRNRAREAAPPPGVTLADVRERLELLVEAALGVPLRIRAAVLPPPRTVLSRLFNRVERARPREILAGTDGRTIFLPPRIEVFRTSEALDLYRVLALHQASRIVRGTAKLFPWTASLRVQDLYLLSETAAAEAQLAERLPGLRRPMAEVRHMLLSARPPLDRVDAALRPTEALYRRLLETGSLQRASDPGASLAWAHAEAMVFPQDERYTGFPSDVLLGAVLEPDAVVATNAGHGDMALQPQQPPRSVRLTRRPRARRAAEDEDDEHTGLWMIQTTQPSEHVEDAMGLQRPVDKQPDEDLQGTAESVSDLEELRLVSAPGSPREILAADDERPAGGARPASAIAISTTALAYPEWDHTIAAYRERAAVVRLLDPAEGSARWVEDVLARHRPTLLRVKRRFEALRSRRSLQHAEPEGDELDLEAYVSAYGDRRARLPREDALYVTHRPARRDFSLLLLIDVSASTESWCGGAHRIIDLEKEALVIVSTALDALRVRFAIQAFSGYGPADVRVRQVKSFEERFGHVLARRVAALEPDEYTRAGAAIRHATATLMREPAYRRLLLLLSDGKPNDCDQYEGRYGAEDTRQALAEARLQGVAPFCVTVDRAASRYLPFLFGAGNYTIVTQPEHMTRALLEWLRTVTAAIA